MEKSHSSRYQISAAASPRLLRCKSGSKAVSSPLPEAYTLTSKFKKKSKKAEENDSSGSSDDGFVRFLRRSDSKIEVPRRTRSASTSPSAWALSPGRSLPCSSPAPPVPKHPKSSDKLVKAEGKSGGGGGGVGGVLKYFRQKKVSPVLEEEYHRYRVVYNRLLQWRFVNARAEASMANVKRVSQVC
ncbi:hypothetical protein RD792_005228 [Penstemon davidsonii]|uniref:Uncharacterized protein n=1 Tax=Penstemon davidsonii TaxID=160366 RepID=A0ABR0DK37_9LAMI|nr:hypothetical protein RD792_005228 [Penstemon davidsonii]